MPQLLWYSKWTSLPMCQENEPFLLPWNRIDYIQIEIIKCVVDAFIFFARTSITTLRHAWTLKSALCIVFRALFMARLIISCARFQAIAKHFLALFNTDIVIVFVIRICLAFLNRGSADKQYIGYYAPGFAVRRALTCTVTQYWLALALRQGHPSIQLAPHGQSSL